MVLTDPTMVRETKINTKCVETKLKITRVVFCSQQNLGNQGHIIRDLARRPEARRATESDLYLRLPKQRPTSSAQLPWRTSTTLLIMQRTVWNSEALVGRKQARRRRKKREASVKRNNRQKTLLTVPLEQTGVKTLLNTGDKDLQVLP